MAQHLSLFRSIIQLALMNPTAQIQFLPPYIISTKPILKKHSEMATLDSPLEVLAFDYVSFILNNLWTWIAVVTAAVSFWRIRATTNSSNNNNDVLKDETPREPPKQQATATKTGPRVTLTETGEWSTLLCNDGVTKGKLTVYYEEEIDGGKDNDDGELTAVNYGGGECDEWWEKWERVVRMRNGGDGWYRYVDLTVINGNVVKLWDANGVVNGGWVSVERSGVVMTPGYDIFRKF